jgi:RNA polymerase sigma-70 factor, ECF subfamily
MQWFEPPNTCSYESFDARGGLDGTVRLYWVSFIAMSESQGRLAREHRPPEPADMLMERYAGGEDAVFSALYSALAPRVRSFLLRLTRGSRRTDDLLQETFFRMHRARGHFETGARVLPWAFTIARNAFLDQARQEGRRREAPEELDERNAPVASETPASSLEGEQSRICLQRALDVLPANQREAFLLVRFEGVSAAEAAQILDTTEANVRVRVHRAAESLRAALASRGAS